MRRASIFRLLFLAVIAMAVLGQNSECPSFEITNCPTPQDITFLDDTYTYQPEYTANPSFGPVTWTLANGPAGMEIDSASGLLSWTVDLPGDFEVTIVGEHMGASDFCSFRLFAGLRLDINPRTENGPHEGTVNVEVIDERSGQPIEGAFVMIGQAEDNPFPGNIGTTDGDGKVTIGSVPEGAFDLHVGKPGYTNFSLYTVNAADIVVTLKTVVEGLPSQAKPEGNVTDWGSSTSGETFAAFVTRELDIDTIMSFDINGILAPNRTVILFGIPLALPGNVAIPKQGNLEVDYLIPVSPGKHTFASVGGKIANDDLLAIINSGSTDIGVFIAKLLNAMDLQRAGILKDQNVGGNPSGLDIRMNNTLEFTQTFSVSNIPAGKDVMAAELMFRPFSGPTPFAGFLPTGICIYLDGDSPPPGACAQVTGDGIDMKLSTVRNDVDGGAYEGLSYNIVVTAGEVSGGTGQASTIVARNIDRRVDLTFNNFFKPIGSMRVSGSRFTHASAYNGDIDPPSPLPGLTQSRLSLIQLVEDPENPDNLILLFTELWNIMTPGQVDGEDFTQFTLPVFPDVPNAPISLESGQPYLWELRISAMEPLEGEDAFDFNAYEFKTYFERATHASTNSIAFFKQ